MNIYFIAGMPRSGATLLANVLAQNPRFHPFFPSGLLELSYRYRGLWDTIIQHKQIDWQLSELKKLNTLKAVWDAYYEDVPQEVIIDYDRGWLAHINMIEYVLERKAKIIVPVRDLREILASFELMWREQSKSRIWAQEDQHYLEMRTVEGRCFIWSSIDQPVGKSYRRIEDAVHRGYMDRIHFIHFERFTRDPEAEIAAVYEFLEEKPFSHRFDHIDQVTSYSQDAVFHGIPEMHRIIETGIKPLPVRRSLLGSVADKYIGPHPWDNSQ